MWLGAGLLAGLVAVAGGTFAWVDREGAETTALLRDQLDPAVDSVHELSAAVHANETAYLAYLVTRDVQFLGQAKEEAAQVVAQVTALHRDADDVLVVKAALPTLDAQLATWIRTVQPTGSAPAGDGPAEQTQVAARLAASTGLLTDAQRLSKSLRVDRDSRWVSAFQDRGDAFLFVEMFAAVLLLLLVTLTALTSRRVMSPLADLEKHMRQTAEGVLDGAAAPRRGWLMTPLTLESERLRMRLKEYRWDSRRDREALEQNGETALGLGRLLTDMGRPGPGVRAHGVLVAAEGLIAGDFLDIVELPDGATALVQGDISGHGVQAGLLATQAKSAVVSALRLGYGAQAAVHAAWTVLVDEDERFVTLAIVVLDPAGQAVHWVNAGHEEPFLRRAGGEVERLESTGPLVSPVITPAENSWALRRSRFHPGDLLVMTTDGLTEARGDKGPQFGERQLEELMRGMSSTEPLAVVRALYLAAERYGIDWQRDDVTVLAAAFEGGP